MFRQIALNKALLPAIVTMLLAHAAWAQTSFNVLYAFNATDGKYPGLLVFDASGNLYGTATEGGSHSRGAVFELTSTSSGWDETLLYNFCSLPHCTDGANPNGGLIVDSTGNLYGVTGLGGSNSEGEVFELTPTASGWTETVLYNFCSAANCADGAFPSGGLIRDSAGNLYGAAAEGGASCDCGLVYQLTPTSSGAWIESVLYTFPGGKDGSSPTGVIRDAAGNFYGVAGGGGDFCMCGLVFELTPNGSGAWTENVLHTFSGGPDGGYPQSLTLDPAGNLYGTTWDGGDTSCANGQGCGVVFELAPTRKEGWKETALYAFTGQDGENPSGGVTFDSAGNLFGTTYHGGVLSCLHGGGCGVVFELTPVSGGQWQEHVLHLCTIKSGTVPSAGVILDAKGNVYGTMAGGGAGKAGVVYEVTR